MGCSSLTTANQAAVSLCNTRSSSSSLSAWFPLEPCQARRNGFECHSCTRKFICNLHAIEGQGRIMDQSAALLAAAVTLLGTAIGLRFIVYVLLPAGLVVLIVSVLAQLISNKMAGWGAQGTIGLLVLLNAGFAIGLILRMGAAFWSTSRIAQLFARPPKFDQQMGRPDGAGRETSGDGCEPATTMAPGGLAKKSFRR